MSGANRVQTVLTIAGSDPSGGAGIQADLKTLSRLRIYGMAVVAAMTAQNTLGVSGIAEVSADFVQQQLDAVLTDITPDAAKTGMLLNSGVIAAVARKLKQYGIRNLVVDPVMISTSGTRLMEPDAMEVLQETLLPLALLVTPNIEEASALARRPIRTLHEMEEAARQIHRGGPKHVLIKGGHLRGEYAQDVFFDGDEFLQLQSRRVPTQNTHGTGCVLSASIAGYLALGKSIEEAVALGKEFVTGAITNALQLGHGRGPCDPLSLGG